MKKIKCLLRLHYWESPNSGNFNYDLYHLKCKECGDTDEYGCY